MIRLILPAILVAALLIDLAPAKEAIGSIFGKGLLYQLVMLDRLGFAFMLGAAAYIFRDRIRLSWIALAILFACNLAAHYFGVGLHIRALFIGYAVLCFGVLTAKRGAISGTWPDYSYGMYIYAFPLMMLLYAVFPVRSHFTLALLNLFTTLPVAALSWHLLEKPALDAFRRRRKLSQDPTVAAAMMQP
jgi:peptidoglycan/LPS O-acetylase OafA/YrhL